MRPRVAGGGKVSLWQVSLLWTFPVAEIRPSAGETYIANHFSQQDTLSAADLCFVLTVSSTLRRLYTRLYIAWISITIITHRRVDQDMERSRWS